MKNRVTLFFIILIILSCKHEVLFIINVPSNFIYSTADTTIIGGLGGSSVAPTINAGGGNVIYSIPNTLAGISINSKTGIINWSPSAGTGIDTIIVSATNSAGIITTPYILKIVSTAPSNIQYSPSGSTIIVGNSGNSSTPTIITGGSPVTYNLSGIIPFGITINATNGIINWDTTVPIGIYNLSVSATNNKGTTNIVYTLIVDKAGTIIAPNGFAYNPSSITLNQGVNGNSVIPTINNGSGTITYSLSGTIPSGISINSSTGVINCNTTVAAGSYSLSVTATNSAGTAYTVYTITENSSTVSFSNDILPILVSNCSGCHSYASSYSGVISRTSGCNSIQNKISTTYCSGSRMPRGGNPLSASFIALFNTWISQGELNN